MQKDFFSFLLYFFDINTHSGSKSDNKYIFGDLALKNIPMNKDFVDKKDFLGLYKE